MASNTSGTMTTRKAAREASRTNINGQSETNLAAPTATGNTTAELNGTQNGTMNSTAGNTVGGDTVKQPCPFSKASMSKLMRKLPKLSENVGARVENSASDILLQDQMATDELSALEEEMIAMVKQQFQKVRSKTPSKLLSMQLSDLFTAGSEIGVNEDYDFYLDIPRKVLASQVTATAGQGGDSKKPARKPFPNEEVVVYSKHGTPLAIDDLHKARVRIQQQQQNSTMTGSTTLSSSTIKIPSMPRVAQSARK